MHEQVSFFNFSIYKIISKEQSFLDQARIRLLYYGFFLVFVACGALLISVYFQGQMMLARTSVFLMLAVAILFKTLTYRPNWYLISHILLIVGSLANISIVYVSLQSINIITVQVVIIIIVFSYYMVGQKWGLIY